MTLVKCRVELLHEELRKDPGYKPLSEFARMLLPDDELYKWTDEQGGIGCSGYMAKRMGCIELRIITAAWVA